MATRRQSAQRKSHPPSRTGSEAAPSKTPARSKRPHSPLARFRPSRLITPKRRFLLLDHDQQIASVRKTNQLDDIPYLWVEEIAELQLAVELYKERSPETEAAKKAAKDAQWLLAWQRKQVEWYRQRFQSNRAMGGEVLSVVVRRAMSWAVWDDRHWSDFIKLVQWDARWLFDPHFERQVHFLTVRGDPRRKLKELGCAFGQIRWYYDVQSPDAVERLKERLRVHGCTSVRELICRRQEGERLKAQWRARGIKEVFLKLVFPTSVDELFDAICELGWIRGKLCENPDYRWKFLKRSGLL